MQSIVSFAVTLFVFFSSSALLLSLPSPAERCPPVHLPSGPLVPRRNESWHPDHSDWDYQNGRAWWELDNTLQDHFRFHCYLAMSIYGPYKQNCPKTFTRGFTVLEEFANTVYTAAIPEMRKVVLVFAGPLDHTTISWEPVTIEDLVSQCSGCMVAKGVKELYLRIKCLTNDFAVARNAAKADPVQLRFSVTGLGVGGAVAALAGLVLGSQGLVHYAHQSGAPRAFNYPAMVRYDNLFQFISGQSIVAKNDYLVHAVPMNPFYHLGQKIHIHGDKTQWVVPCWGNNENVTCLGDGSSRSDHLYYFTKLGQCGTADKGF